MNLPIKQIIAATCMAASLTTANAAFTFYRSLKTLHVQESVAGGGTGETNPPPVVQDTITLSDYNNGYLPSGNVGDAYNFDMKTLASVSGSTSSVSNLTWSIANGVLPNGIALATTGELSGVPDAVVSNNVEIKAKTPNGNGSRIYTIVINAATTIKALAIAGGGYHTCAIDTSHRAMCWGKNNYGQLGDGTTVNKNKPVYVIGIPSDVTQIVTGQNHTCAVSSSAGLMCWGVNNNGQLGDNTSTTRSTPASVSNAPANISKMVAGSDHTCVLAASGMKCWGYNNNGQLGNGTTALSKVPVAVSSTLQDVTDITAGMYHTCALSSSQGMKCWGNNSFGGLGDGTVSAKTTPVSVSGLLSDITSFSAGKYHTCAISASQGMKCWGSNNFGQIGNGTTSSSVTTPTSATVVPTGAIKVYGGWSWTCSQYSNGSLLCWGYNGDGAVGNGAISSTAVLTPATVVNLSADLVSVSAGFYHMCATTSSQGIKCWGRGTENQLGNSTATSTGTPSSASLP